MSDNILLPSVLFLVPDVEKLQSDLKKEQKELQDTKEALGAVHFCSICQKANSMLCENSVQ